MAATGDTATASLRSTLQDRDDDTLLELCREGNRGAFLALLTRYEPYVYA